MQHNTHPPQNHQLGGLPHLEHKTLTHHNPTQSGGEVDKPLKLCPWLKSVPSRLLERLTWAKAPTAALQGKGKDILLLYEGLKDGDALDETLAHLQPDLAQKTLAIDIRRKPEAHPNHILDDGFYSSRAPAANKCSSIWATEVYDQWAKTVRHNKIHLDQCRLGQVVQKSTTLSTDLPLHHWQGLECNHGSHTKPKEMKSDDLSRHPPPLMKGLAEAIIQTLPKGRRASSASSGVFGRLRRLRASSGIFGVFGVCGVFGTNLGHICCHQCL